MRSCFICPRFLSLVVLALVLLFTTSSLPLVAAEAANEAPVPVNADDFKAAKNDIKAAKQAANIAWMIVATALVMLMIPGLALFYGGMVRRKNILGTMMQSMIALGIVGVQWVVIGYSLAFGHSHAGIIGWSPELVLLDVAMADKTFPGTDCPVYLHAMFQGMFAIITVALISGAFAERVKFSAYCLFALLWTTLVYDPLAHWVWAFKWTETDGKFVNSGWLGVLGALDFAGGTVVHIAAGMAGLASVIVLRKRRGYPEHTMHPNSMVLTLLGAGLLWFGWFGFNAGSATSSSVQAVSALAATQVAAAAAGLAWVVVEWLHKGKPTALGFASGVVAGLVAVTPASGFVAPGAALLIGIAAGCLCYGAVLLKPLLGYDDSLDAFGIHGVGGLIGALLTGALVSVSLWRIGSGSPETEFPGVMKDGVAAQVIVQLIACLVASAFSFIVTAVLVAAIENTIGFTLSSEDESRGLDRAVHGEVGFDYVDGQVAEETPTSPQVEPKAASAPPATDDSQERFTLVVEGPRPEELRKAWLKLCEPRDTPASPEIIHLYRYMTTLSGNKFRFRGGNHITLRENLRKALEDTLEGTPVKIHAEV